MGLGSGTAMIRLPRDFEHLAIDDKPVAAGVLAQLCQLVTPILADKTQTLEEETKLDLFLDHLRSSFWKPESKKSAPSFSCSKVQFEGLRPESYEEGGPTFWRLSRQVMRPEERTRTKFDVTKLSTTDTGNIRHLEHVSEWVFWDNRFWIQITTTDKRLFDHLAIRAFQGPDWGPWSKQFPKQVAKTYRGIMNNHTPGKIRYTLPVLDFQGSIIAFPTLTDEVLETKALKRWVEAHDRETTPQIKWQVNYKVLPESIVKWASTVNQKKRGSPSPQPTCTPSSTSPLSPEFCHSPNQTPPSPSAHVASPAPSELSNPYC